MDEAAAKVERKRRAILKIALRIFAKEGFRNTDVQVIADLAKVGKGTVYRHFGNKEQLFLATARYAMEDLLEFVEQEVGTEEDMPKLVAQEGTVAVLKTIAVSCAVYYQKHPQAIEIMIQERAEFREGVYPTHLLFRSEAREGIDQMFTQAIASGEIRKIEAEAATNAYADLIFGSVVNGVLEGGRAQLVQRVEKAVDLLIHGLAAH